MQPLLGRCFRRFQILLSVRGTGSHINDHLLYKQDELAGDATAVPVGPLPDPETVTYRRPCQHASLSTADIPYTYSLLIVPVGAINFCLEANVRQEESLRSEEAL